MTKRDDGDVPAEDEGHCGRKVYVQASPFAVRWFQEDKGWQRGALLAQTGSKRAINGHESPRTCISRAYRCQLGNPGTHSC